MEDGRKPILVAALVIWGLIAIATSCAVWNSKPGAFLSVVAALNLAINGFCIYRQATKLKD